MTDQASDRCIGACLKTRAIRKLAPKTHRDHVQRSRTSRRSSAVLPTRLNRRRCAAFGCIWRRAAQAQSQLQSRPRSMPFNSSAYADSAFCAEG
jgi:hypothetical protein